MRGYQNRARLQMWVIFAFTLSALAAPALALDEPYALSHDQVSHHYRRRVPIGICLTFLVLIGHYAVAFSGTLVGPSMGITSVLWLMMRNDAAITPKASWMVLGAWSFLTLTYFMIQCHRVSNHRLYILLTVAITSFCMCLVAVVQKSSLQGGLVTAIPTCTSFAAYGVAYFFPDRYVEITEQWSTSA
ncbi:hypothetical protein BKA66DRAFT_316727 [Pyrenochaeta sp. MPI-SDFR-AT-0127]|nr:hypothetical protein BKA66DRAFT_316727 [Pyrenochaeta sp. MPI-SDFR-AT-0127]